MERLAAALDAAGVRDPEELYGQLLSGSFPGAGWLSEVAAPSGPPDTGEFDQCERHATNFASGAMSVLRERND